MFDSFLRLERFKYLKVAVALSLLCIALYALHDPTDPPNGGTWLGYTLGTLTGGICIWLAWLGVRKRQFSQGASNLRSWVSAHVYLGLSLLVIGSLHAGFQFGWNVHTLAYVFMVLVIVSGIYGIVVYARYPSLITRNRRGTDPDGLLREILDIDNDLLKLADKVGGRTQEGVARSVQRTRIGGGWLAQLRGIRGNPSAEAIATVLDEADTSKKPAADADKKQASMSETMMFMASRVFKAEDPQRTEKLRRITAQLARKQDLVARLNRDITHRARMRAWLFLHIPLTVGLLAALLVHVIAVFFYW